MKALELPPTLRTAKIEEIPNTSENQEWLLQRDNAKIIQGYTYKSNPGAESLFDFYCEINIDNSKLWELFGTLLFTLPEEISFIYSHVDSDPTFSPYLDRLDVIKKISKYSKQLTQDGLVEFGAIYQDADYLGEVFVKKSKYIQFWGNDYHSFQNIMAEFGIQKIDDLAFIDEYPLVTTPLRLYDSTAMDIEDLIAKFDLEFRG